MTNELDKSDTVEGLDLISSVKLVQVTALDWKTKITKITIDC